jgi:putative NADPH-quinone reductase
MGKRLLVINGHVDPRPERLCHALCEAYARGAREGGHEVRRIDVGALDFPVMRTSGEFFNPDVPTAIAGAQQDIAWAEHLVIVYPLWLGGQPALLRGFLEQTFRYGFALAPPGSREPKGLLAGRTARVVVTMGMPAAAYVAIFGAFGERALERAILWFAGIHPIRRTLFGGVETASAGARAGWLRRLERLGKGAA